MNAMDSIKELGEDIERERIARARRTPPLEKFLAGVELFEFSCELMAAGVRHQFPEADESQVAEIVRQRLDLARRLELHP
jgi:hypothetical protein